MRCLLGSARNTARNLLSEEDAMEIGVKFPVGYAVDDEDPDGTME
jgi:hypothetical protein